MSTARALTKRQLRELEAELNSERRRLERSMTVEPETDDWMRVGNSAVGAVAATHGALGAALQTRTHARYDAITDALTRLAAGGYGSCAGCQEPIPYGRLIVMPEATHCVACHSRA